MIVLKNKTLLDDETKEVYSDNVTPKFQGLMYDDYRRAYKKDKSIRYLTPMKAEELMGDDLEVVINDPDTIAEQKWDGHRALNFFTETSNRIFSRNVSKQTNWFSENSDQMPHIRDTVRVNIKDSVIDGEITLPIENCSCREVQSVTGALPETALKNQLEKGFAIFNAFDILYYKGVNVQHMPYWKRKVYLWKVISETCVPFIVMCPIYATQSCMEKLRDLWMEYDPETSKNGLLGAIKVVEDYKSLYKNMIEREYEGIILKNIYCEYEQKRSKNFVKMKGHNTYDCIIMGYEEPTKDFDGKTDLKEWQFWESYEGGIYTKGLPENQNMDECRPVTKFYAMGWIGAIHIGVWKRKPLQTFIDEFGEKGYRKELDKMIKAGTLMMAEDNNYYELVKVGRCAGLDDETRAEISNHKEQYLGAVVEVEAQKIINNKTGSLQHPRFLQFRPDKESEECTFETHIRRYGEDK